MLYAREFLWWFSLSLSLPLFILGMFACYWQSYAWHSPEKHLQTRFVHTRETTHYTFSMIVPVRDEIYEVMNATVSYALRQTHPQVQIVIVAGFDDPDTQTVARRIIDENPGRDLMLAVSTSPVRNKPTQLNAALPYCTGEIIGILDAESVSAPGLLTQVDAAFQDAGVEVVQGGVIFTNYRSSFVALRSVLEYYAHHCSKMHFSAKQGSVLMGGNTVFFRRPLLNQLGGWDATNVAEDAEISIRIQTLGHEVYVAYDPHLVTREEAPTKIRAWVKQRTRWNLGFLQTIAKKEWKYLPTRRQKVMTLWNLYQPALMALTGLTLPLAAISAFSGPPLVIAMLSWLPAIPVIFLVAIDCGLLHSFGLEQGYNIRRRDYLKVVFTTPIYMVIMAWAATRAYIRYRRGDFGWEKTRHAGLHIAALETVNR